MDGTLGNNSRIIEDKYAGRDVVCTWLIVVVGLKNKIDYILSNEKSWNSFSLKFSLFFSSFSFFFSLNKTFYISPTVLSARSLEDTTFSKTQFRSCADSGCMNTYNPKMACMLVVKSFDSFLLWLFFFRLQGKNITLSIVFLFVSRAFLLEENSH